MLELNDPLWHSLRGGYWMPYDPTPALRRLYAGEEVEAAWTELWDNLHHQGQVGEASYAAVPHLVRIQMEHAYADANAYALIGCIEVERHNHGNPPLRPEFQSWYEAAWTELLPVALRDYSGADSLTAHYILGALALCKGLRRVGELVTLSTDDEIKDVAQMCLEKPW